MVQSLCLNIPVYPILYTTDVFIYFHQDIDTFLVHPLMNHINRLRRKIYIKFDMDPMPIETCPKPEKKS